MVLSTVKQMTRADSENWTVLSFHRVDRLGEDERFRLILSASQLVFLALRRSALNLAGVILVAR